MSTNTKKTFGATQETELMGEVIQAPKTPEPSAVIGHAIGTIAAAYTDALGMLRSDKENKARLMRMVKGLVDAENGAKD